MKKIFTLVFMLALFLAAGAQETTYRKSWDFTKWSAATVANLMAESALGPTTGAWSDVEKATATEPTDYSRDNCFWEVTAQGNATEGTTLRANNEVIAELEGLLYTNTTARSLAIAVNYPDLSATSAGFGPYHGPSYLWLGSSGKNYFVIPHVAPGTVIRIGVESHKLTDARGLQLFAGVGNTGTQLNDPEGLAVPAPTDYTEQEWLLPEELPDTPNDDGTYDVTIRNTNGCHIYFITVGEGDQPKVEETKKVAYVYRGSLDEDIAFLFLDSDSNLQLTPVETGSDTDLTAFDCVVFATSLQDDDFRTLRPLFTFVPIVNLNMWYYQESPYLPEYTGHFLLCEGNGVTIADPDNPIFEGIDNEIFYDTSESYLIGLELGPRLQDDKVLAYCTEQHNLVAMHVHNPERNAFYFIMGWQAPDEVYETILPRTVLAAAKSRHKVTPRPAPVITVEQQDGASVVTITATPNLMYTHLYYTVNGEDPTADNAADYFWTGPFTLRQNATVKAIATGGEGYYDSPITQKEVIVAHKALKPTFSIDRENGRSVVTLSTASDNADLYYNFTGTTLNTSDAQKYTEPIVLTDEPATVYAFAQGEGTLQSDIAQVYVDIEGLDANTIRLDTLAHFDAARADWWIEDGSELLAQLGGEVRSGALYYFGRSAWNYYSGEVDHEEEGTDDEGNPTTITVYKPDENAYREYSSPTASDWILKSQGQVLTLENIGPAHGIGGNDGTTNGRGNRYAEFAEDDLGGEPTTGVITFGGKSSGEPYTGRVESTRPFAGPFDVVVYAGNGNSAPIDSKPVHQIQVSADGQNWTSIGNVKFADTRRYYKKTRVHYDEAAPVYVRVAQTSGGSSGQLYDIYLLYNGELSQAYGHKQGIAGPQAAGQAVRTEVFTLGGMRTAGHGKGLHVVRTTYANGTVTTTKVLK